MHILYPIGTFYPAQSGGPSNSVYWLAKSLVRQGVRVSVVSTATDQPDTTPLGQWLDTEAGRVNYVPTRRHAAPVRAIREALRTLPTADIVHLTSLFYTTSLVVGLVALWRGQRVVWSPRGELSSAALAIRPRPKSLVINLLKRWADRIIFHATSEEETKAIHRQFGPAARVIELPNYIELPPPAAPHPPANYLLYLGRLHPIKALDKLLNALARSTIFRTGTWQLQLVGPDNDGHGTYLRDLARQLGIHEQVRFGAAIAGEAKHQLLANAHALILPSHSENFGNVVVEALAQGTPVVASTGTPWQVLAQEKAGYWVANSPDALREAIDDCLSLPTETYAAYRRNAFALAQRDYDSITNGHRWLTAYAAIAADLDFITVCAE